MSDTATIPGSYVPSLIPEEHGDQAIVPTPPSVWAAGDVHQTHEQVYESSPAGVQAANAPDPRDQEIMRLQAIIAGTSKDPNYVAEEDPKDAEIAELRRRLAGPSPEADAPVEATATVVDPRDAEIADLRRELEEAKASDVPKASDASNVVEPEPAAADEVTPA